MRDLLEKQILKDAKDGDTTVLGEILNQLSDDQVFNSLSDYNQESLNFRQLKGGETIKALYDLNGTSNSYNTPENISILKDTVIEVPYSGTRMGDCFCKFVVGKAIKFCRGHNEGEEYNLEFGDIVGLCDGYESAPYSLGRIDIRMWEIQEIE